MKGKVLQVSPAEGKVIVEGVNIVTKHVKPRKMGEPGGLIKAESALYASKVQRICPKCGRPTRIGHAINRHVKSPASWARQRERKDISKEAAMP